jgi:hypothetical protein
MSEGFKRRFLTLEAFMNELERMLGSGGTTSGWKTRALKHVLNYVTGPELKANYISATELQTELMKHNLNEAKRALHPQAAASDDLLQSLRRARRAAAKMRTK